MSVPDAPAALLPAGRLWFRRDGAGPPADGLEPDGVEPDGVERGGAGILVRGADRIPFLTRIMAGALPPSPGAARTALLGPKGNLVAAAVATVLRDRVHLDCEPARREALRAGLDRYRIADRVEITEEPADSAASVTVLGAGPAETVAAALAAAFPTAFPVASPAGPGPSVEAPAALPPGGVLESPNGEDGFVRRDSRPWPSFTVVATPARVERATVALRTAGAFEASPEESHYLRVAAGEPRWGAELDDTALPLASGLAAHVRLGQGCYIGQEYVARQAHRGRVPRLLRLLRLPPGAPPPPRGTEVHHDGRTVGTITSSAPSPTDWPEDTPALALAVLPAEIAPGSTVTCAGAEATVQALP